MACPWRVAIVDLDGITGPVAAPLCGRVSEIYMSGGLMVRLGAGAGYSFQNEGSKIAKRVFSESCNRPHLGCPWGPLEDHASPPFPGVTPAG